MLLGTIKCLNNNFLINRANKAIDFGPILFLGGIPFIDSLVTGGTCKLILRKVVDLSAALIGILITPYVYF